MQSIAANKIFSFKKVLSISAYYFLTLGLIIISTGGYSQDQEDHLPVTELKKLSIEDLMNIEVTSVTKRPQKLMESASAIQIITKEAIHSFGATSLPEALRLAGNLIMAQSGPNDWVVSARGFNAPLANKLLVLIDGRAIYTPLYAGVWWDIEDVLLEDVERIEVISGPGGTLWGANAVNGVINVITKNAKNTRGWLVQAGGGNELHAITSVQYGGGSKDSTFNYRVYGKYSNRDATVFPNGCNSHNDWQMGQSGFRMDWKASDSNRFTFQGDIFRNREERLGLRHQTASGGNVLARWTHTFSEKSDFKLQVYYDNITRNAPGTYRDAMNTYDVDFQHSLPVRKKHYVVWGGGYRLAYNSFTEDTSALNLIPNKFPLQIYNLFAQDEIKLRENFTLTVGTKILYNSFTHFEIQPNIRAGWMLDSQQFLWAAISRAVRLPSIIDRDLYSQGFLAGGPNFNSEVLIAYELGYRLQPNDQFYLSLATYFNHYNGIRSLEPLNPPTPQPVVIANGQTAESYGAEMALNYQVTKDWRLEAKYTFLNLNIWPSPGSRDTSHGAVESYDSHNFINIRSIINITPKFEFDPSFRYVSRITNPVQPVPGYVELDLRLAWQVTKNFELSIVGRNLLHEKHPEFGNPLTRNLIQRSIFGKALWRF